MWGKTLRFGEVLAHGVAEQCVLQGVKWRSFAQKEQKGKQQCKSGDCSKK